ncbi:MAG: hypothetical protein H7Z12_00630 [Rhodospirillaceae bacterium]|nr:hypothetical protein [Rhodospirillales bacterium]
MTLITRRVLLSLLAVTAITGCTIEMPDLALEVAMTPIPGPTYRVEVRVTASKDVIYHGVMVDDEPVHAVGHGVRFDAVIVPPGFTERPRRLLGTMVLVDGGPTSVRAPAEKSFSIDQVLTQTPVVWRQVLKDWTSMADGRQFRVTQKP